MKTLLSRLRKKGAVAVERFLDHVARHRRVWFCRRIDIARHWHAQHAVGGALP